jgi:hypothetical protein
MVFTYVIFLHSGYQHMSATHVVTLKIERASFSKRQLLLINRNLIISQKTEISGLVTLYNLMYSVRR